MPRKPSDPKPERTETSLEPVTDQAFKHLVQRLLDTPPKHKSSSKPKRRKRRSQGH